jgi:uncharacterized membrane protein YhaH (DUF805 family)
MQAPLRSHVPAPKGSVTQKPRKLISGKEQDANPLPLSTAHVPGNTRHAWLGNWQGLGSQLVGCRGKQHHGPFFNPPTSSSIIITTTLLLLLLLLFTPILIVDERHCDTGTRGENHPYGAALTSPFRYPPTAVVMMVIVMMMMMVIVIIIIIFTIMMTMMMMTTTTSFLAYP